MTDPSTDDTAATWNRYRPADRDVYVAPVSPQGCQSSGPEGAVNEHWNVASGSELANVNEASWPVVWTAGAPVMATSEPVAATENERLSGVGSVVPASSVAWTSNR